MHECALHPKQLHELFVCCLARQAGKPALVQRHLHIDTRSLLCPIRGYSKGGFSRHWLAPAGPTYDCAGERVNKAASMVDKTTKGRRKCSPVTL